MIIHLDLDAFFASAERTRDPSLKGRPIVVGGRSDPFIFDKRTRHTRLSAQNSGAFVPTLFERDERVGFERFFKEGERIRGIVITSSYEARNCGIKTGMSLREALERCPGLIVLPPDHGLYHRLSNRLRIWLAKQIPVVEQYSIDEFFGDLKGWIGDRGLPDFLTGLQRQIKTQFDLPISIGAAPTKWIAKLATSFAKPEGIRIVYANQVDTFIRDIPIDAFPGIGRSFNKRLRRYHKETLGDVKASKELLFGWGRGGRDLYRRIAGEDKEAVENRKIRKSIGISRTFDPITDRIEIQRRLTILVRHLSFLATQMDLHPGTIHLGIRYRYGTKAKKQQPFLHLFSEQRLREEVLALFGSIDTHPTEEIIRLSLSLRNFREKKGRDISLFDLYRDKQAMKLNLQTQKLRKKYGVDVVKIGKELW